MNYIALNKTNFRLDAYSVLPFRDEDKFKIKEWRNQQMDILRQKNLLTDADQLNYYNTCILPCFHKEQPRMMLFSFLENNVCIGYGGLTNIDWECKRTELSFLMNPSRMETEGLYEKDFSAFITFMKMIAFEELKFNRIFTETYDVRPLHVSILEKNGFKAEGRMKEHVLIHKKFTDSLIHGCLKKDYDA